MALTDYVNPFIDQSQYGLSPEAIAARRRYAYGLMQQAGSGEPTKANAIGAIARAIQGAAGGYMVGQSEKEEQKGLSANADMLAGMFGGGASSGSVPPSQPTAPAPMSQAPMPADGTAGAFQGNTQLAGRFGNFQQGPTPGTSMPAPPPMATAGLPRGLRNNNPLNIEAGGFTQGQPGFAGSDGRFARFQSPDQGMQAANTLLDSYAKRGLTTPAAIVGRWAPSSDGNNVKAYAADVASKLGIGPNDPITPSMRPQLIAAMAAHENGQAMDPQTVARALGGGTQLAGPVPTPNSTPMQGTPQIPPPQPPPGVPQQATPQAGQSLQSPQIQKLISVARDQTANPYQRQFATKMLEGIVQKQLSGDWRPVTRPDGSIALANSATGEIRSAPNDPSVIKGAGELEASKAAGTARGVQETAKSGLQGSVAEVKQTFPLLIDDATNDLTSPGEMFRPKTGMLASQQAKIGGTPAANLQQKLEAVRNIAGQQYAEQRKLALPAGRSVMPQEIEDFKKQLILDVGDPKQTKITLQRLKQKYGSPAAGSVLSTPGVSGGSAVAAPAPLKSGTYNWTPQGLVPQ